MRIRMKTEAEILVTNNLTEVATLLKAGRAEKKKIVDNHSGYL
jgi:hypothetical protein